MPIMNRVDEDDAEFRRRKINNLSRKINITKQENIALQNEITEMTLEIRNVVKDTKIINSELDTQMNALEKSIENIHVDGNRLSEILNDLSDSYFSFKNISAAVKNISNCTEEYEKRYRHYSELRRIALGYVIGLDHNVPNIDTMRKSVEKTYLKNTDYWLAYAMAATMLWRTGSKEAADRAMARSMELNQKNTCIYFLIVNLRFGRLNAAKKWLVYYLDKVNETNIGSEWQYLISAYLNGAFGQGTEFESIVSKSIYEMYENLTKSDRLFEKRVAAHAKKWAETLLHETDAEYTLLKEVCKEYDFLKKQLSAAEKNTAIASYFDDLARGARSNGTDIEDEIENVLYNLITSYDDGESDIVKKLTYNELLVETNGNEERAKEFYDVMFDVRHENQSFDELLISWVFPPNAQNADPDIRKFAISLIKEPLLKGFSEYVNMYRLKDKITYTFNIDGYEVTCGEHDTAIPMQKLNEYYEVQQSRNLLTDKFMWIFGALAVLSLIILIASYFTFSRIALVFGLLLFISGSFLFVRRYFDIINLYDKKKKRSEMTFKKAQGQLSALRSDYFREDMNFVRVKNVLKRY